MQATLLSTIDDSFLVFFTEEEISYIKEKLNERELSFFNVHLWMCNSYSEKHLSTYSVTLSFGFHSISRWFDCDKKPMHYVFSSVKDIPVYKDTITDSLEFVKFLLQLS